MLTLINLRDKQSIGKVGRRFLGLRSLKIQTQCAGCDGAIEAHGQQIRSSQPTGEKELSLQKTRSKGKGQSHLPTKWHLKIHDNWNREDEYDDIDRE